jgi:hypothetical protein
MRHCVEQFLLLLFFHFLQLSLSFKFYYFLIENMTRDKGIIEIFQQMRSF